MKRIALLALALLGLVPAFAQTNIVAGMGQLSGTWTLAGSPYHIYTGLWVPPHQTLRIEAGVEVIFHGLYDMQVSGCLQIDGGHAEGQRVVFHAADTTGWHDDTQPAGGWRGIRLAPAWPNDSSYIRGADFRDMKIGDAAPNTTVWVGTFFFERTVDVTDCTFSHGQNKFDGMLYRMAATNGVVTFKDCEFYDNHSTFGAMYCEQPSTIKLLNTKIHDHPNCFLFVGNANVVVEDCEIYNNNASEPLAVLYFTSASGDATIRRNKIYNNTCDNHAVITSHADMLWVDNNYICNNSLTKPQNCGLTDGGTALHIYPGSHGKTFIVRNNVIANNYCAFNGGAIAVNGATILFANNTIVNNKADGWGAAIYAQGSTTDLTLRNNIFYNNVSGSSWNAQADVTLWNAANIAFDHNWMETNNVNFLEGYGTVTSDTIHNIQQALPGFVNPTTVAGLAGNGIMADFRLVSNSMCINKGDTTDALLLPTDVDGQPRINQKVDMGAHEFQGTSSINSLAATATEVNVYPNPAAKSIAIPYKGSNGVLRIVDMAGREVMHQPFSGGSGVLHADVASLAMGMYQVVVTDAAGGNAATGRFMKK